ncbi:MAG: CHC2 zinc finger domain-containing protein [Solirubrobacterales bacterium]
MSEPALAARRHAASRYVDTLFDTAPGGSLVEVRFRAGAGMRQRFFEAGTSDRIVEAVLNLASNTDVFMGVLPRFRRRGRREDVVTEGRVLWADCDTPSSATELASFKPRPSMAVASGSGRHRHAYWLLREPADLDTIESLNRRLALALGADAGVVTKAQTILRPPGTVNMKHSPPAAVELIGVRESRQVTIDQLDRCLPRLRPKSRGGSRTRFTWPTEMDDPLQSVPPPVYFERLTGLQVGRSGKVRCPFHEDRTPSLHLYEDPTRGWYCFGCGRGGSIYDLAAMLWDRPTHGQGFVELRSELQARFIERESVIGSSVKHSRVSRND